MKIKKGETLPKTYKAAFLKKVNTPLVMEDVEFSNLSDGEVWIKIKASPINPSDLAILIGMYPHKKDYPFVPGLEASGIVVASGGGFMANFLLGKRVICTSSEEGDGTWAEYMRVPAGNCIPLNKSLTYEQGANSIVNPLTALALIERIKESQSQAFINTAAASALGKMLIRLSKKEGITPINIVRRPEQVELLKKVDAKYILDSSSSEFNQEFSNIIQELKPMIILDAISGAFSGELLKKAPNGCTLISYANLSRSDLKIPPLPIIRFDKKIEGFHLASWSAKQSKLKLFMFSRKAQKLIADGTLATSIHSKVNLEELNDGILKYSNKMSSGKHLLSL